MLSFERSRFVSDEAVIKSLTNESKLPAKLKPRLASILHLPENSIIQNLSVVLTKGVGGTQCRPYVVTLESGEKIFLKLSPLAKNALAEQKIADTNIQEVLGKNSTHPFICMFRASGALAIEKETRNELLFFPYVPGDNLFITLTHRNQDKASSVQQFAAVGKCLAEMHIQCMKLLGTYEKFLNDDCLLTKVLVHDDWQATNIMITPENEAMIIDTEGTALTAAKPYRNLAESWELTGPNPVMMEALLDAYTNAFPPELRDKVKNNVVNVLSRDHGIELPAAKSQPPLKL